MSKVDWTPAQQAAINTFGRDVLVSAAAGSGKTAALTERMIRALTHPDHPTDITRILAVTFTRASAAELRRRISKALSERIAEQPQNTKLIRQLMLLGSAKICTIDAFCSDVVRSSFQQIDLPAGFRIPDDTELALLKRSVMEEVIDTSFAEGDPQFAALADCLTSNKDDEALWQTLLGIHSHLLGLADGIEHLKKNAELLAEEADKNYLSDTRSGRYIANALTEQLDYSISLYEMATEELSDDPVTLKKYLPAFEADLEFCRRLADAVRRADYDEARNVAAALPTKRPVGLPADAKTDRTELWRITRGELRADLKAIAPGYLALTSQQLRETFVSTGTLCRALYKVISQFEKKFISEKNSRSICDFDDIRRHAYTLLVDAAGQPTPLAREYAERFDLIFIDEYQDVTEVQDLIFRALSNGHNRFMVGDIKQSIYSFRGAEPSLFSGYRAEFAQHDSAPEDDSGVTVFMSENFRCDRTVIDFVNPICSRMFRACGPSVGYTVGDDLRFAKKCPEGYIPTPVSVVLISGDDNSIPEGSSASSDEAEDSPDAPEMQYIAAEIRRLLSDETGSDGKPLTPGDIAVLCRAHSTCSAVATALKRLNIPVSCDSTEGYYTRPEVSLMISLLTVIDNPQRDIPLAAVLRSPLFAFTMEELSLIRRATPKANSLYDAVVAAAEGADAAAQKCRSFKDKLNDYRHMARALPADRLLRGIYRDTAILSLAPDESCRSDLMRLYDSARQFESGSFHGLYNFIKYVNRSIEAGSNGDSAPTEPSDVAVNVITFHHSKGLEFPVCFVCGCGKTFQFKDSRSDVIFSERLGLGIRIKDSTGLAKLNTPIRHATALESKRAQTEEEMRLLYVAMTRAKERLYVTAQFLKGINSHLDRAYRAGQLDDPYPILNVKCYADWILPAISQAPAPSAPYTFDIIPRNAIRAAETYDTTSSAAATAPSDDPEEFVRKLEERFCFVYPYAHLTRLPAKLSVSKLYPGILDEEQDAPPDLEGAVDGAVPTLSSMTFSPAFLSGIKDNTITSADKGTATHVFLQFCDFERCEHQGVSEELNTLVKQGFIPKRMASLVSLEQIQSFLDSELYAQLRTASDVRREQRFNIMLPAAAFSNEPDTAALLSDEQLLVQGVIDLFFTDSEGRLVLCDYKTDRLTPRELADPQLAAARLSERHGTQLSYYAAALHRICGRRPDRVLIYSLPLGAALDIPTEEI